MKFTRTIRSQESYLNLNLAEIWHARDMLFFLVLRDIKIRFKQSYLGISWAILQPVLTTLIYTLIMNKILDRGFEGPYPLFFLAGLMAWNYFSKVFTNGTLSLVTEAELIKKVYFPRLILPLYQSISVFTDLLIALAMFYALSLWYQWPVTTHIFYLPLFLLLTMTLATSITMWLGPINVRFRDIQIVLPLFIQLLFLVTPIMYPLSSIFEEKASTLYFLYSLNPLVGIIEGFRFCLVGTGSPFELPHMISYALILCLFVSGLAFFNSQQRKFADVI